MNYSEEEIQQIINSVDIFPNYEPQSELELENLLEEKQFLFGILDNKTYDPKNLRLLSNLIKLYNIKYAKWRAAYYNHKQQIKENQGVPFDFATCKYQLDELKKLIITNLN
jgi:hypothetical protein